MTERVVLNRLNDEMRRWIVNQLIDGCSHAQIGDDFLSRYPAFGAGIPLDTVKALLLSRIKGMVSRGKERDEIIEGRKKRLEGDNLDHLPLKDKKYRAIRQQEIFDRIRDINWELSDESLSREKRQALKDERSGLNIESHRIDAFERSEIRGSPPLTSNRPDPETLFRHRELKPPNESDFDYKHRVKPRPEKKPPDREPTEPDWWDIADEDSEHLTV